MFKNLIILLMAILCSEFAFAHGDHSRGVQALEDQFSALGHMHLPVEFGLNGETHLNIPGLKDDAHDVDHGVEYVIHPLVYFGLNIDNQLINNALSNSSNLEIFNINDSYTKITTQKWDLGLGSELEAILPNFTAGIGLSFIKGENYYSERILNSKTENRKKLKLPKTTEIFNSWRINEKMVYGSRSIVIFNLGIGYGPLQVSPYVGIQGQFVFKYKKINDQFLSVEVTNLASKSLGFEGTLVLARTEIEKYTSKGKGFNFLIDMTAPEGVEAFQQILVGNFINAQNLEINNQPYLQAINTFRSIGSTNQIQFSIPFLFTIRKMNTKDFTETNSHLISEDEKENIYISSLSNEFKRTGLLTKNKLDQKIIQSIIVTHDEDHDDHDHDHEHKALSPHEHSILAGNMIWSFEKEKTSKSEVLAKLNQYYAETGLEKLKEIDLPITELGQTRIDFTINLTGDALIQLLDEQFLKELEEEALSTLVLDFNQRGAKFFCKIKNENKCLKNFKLFIKKTISSIKKLQFKITKSYLAKDNNKMLKATTKLLKNLKLSNYIFKTYLKNTPTLKKQIHFVGESFRKTTINL